MNKRKAKQRAKWTPSIENVGLPQAPAEAPLLDEPPASPTGATFPVLIHEAPNLSEVSQGVTGPNRYQLPIGPAEVDRPTSSVTQEDTRETVYVEAESIDIANQYWLLLERAGYEVW